MKHLWTLFFAFTLALSACGPEAPDDDEPAANDDDSGNGMGSGTVEPAIVPVSTINVCLAVAQSDPDEILSGDLRSFVVHDDEGLVFSTETEPDAGVLALLPDGVFTYTPTSALYVGVDAFWYKVVGDRGGEATGRVDVAVGAPCDSPMLGRSKYYVAAHGDDADAGSYLEPFASIQQAADVVAPGEAVIVGRGVYEEHLRFTVSGTEAQPITFLARGDVTIQGGTALTDWTLAPGFSQPVYTTPESGFSPDTMVENGDTRIPRMYRDLDGTFDEDVYGGDGRAFMDEPASATLETFYLRLEIQLWDVAYVVFSRHTDGNVYIRYRDGDDPNTKSLRGAAADAYVIDLRDVGYNEIRGFIIQGANGVRLSGVSCVGNVLQHNTIQNGTYRVRVLDGAANNVIRDNTITQKYPSAYLPGAWDSRSATPSYDDAIKESFYLHFKHLWGPNSSDDYGVSLSGSGADNVVSGNTIAHNIQNVHVGGDVESPIESTQISKNVVYGASSIGIIATMGSGVVYVADNLIYDNNLNIRVHRVDAVGDERTIYMYRNRLWLPGSTSAHIFVHHLDPEVWPAGESHPNVWLYHNSFSGGKYAIHGFNEGQEGLPGFVFLNNILSSDLAWYAGVGDVQHADFRLFDWNWVGGSELYHFDDFTPSPPGWWGTHNVDATASHVYMWPLDQLVDFEIPVESSPQNLAIEAGVDVSQPFTVGGNTYDPLPGFETGYYSGSAPNIGASNEPIVAP